MDVKPLIRQHEDIYSLIVSIKMLIDKGNINEDAAELSKEVSLLAGKLSVHLSSEDKFMYPGLLKNASIEVRNIAQQFIDEMGSISSRFTDYKNRFNTRSKILADPQAFVKETKEILEILVERSEKEDRKLYPLINM